MSQKQKTTWSGSSNTDFANQFSNWFDSLGTFGSTTKSEGEQDTTQHGTTKNTTTGTNFSDITGGGTQDTTTTGTGTVANTYGYMDKGKSAEDQKYEDWINQQMNASDPSIKYEAAAAMRSARNRYTGPFGAGAGSSAATRQQMFKSESEGVREKEGQALIQDAFNRRQQMGANLAQLAQMADARKQLVQTGATSTQTGKSTGVTTTNQHQVGGATQVSEGESDMTGKTTSKQQSDTTGYQASMGQSGGQQSGSQRTSEQGQQTTSQPLWGQLIGGAAQVGAAAATKGASAAA